MRIFCKYLQFQHVESIGHFLIFFTILIFTFGLYGSSEGAVNLSHIKIPKDQGEITESHIVPGSTKSVIIIGERHDLIRVQTNIAQILKGIVAQHSQLHLIGLEGIYMNQRVESPFSNLPQNIKRLNFQEIKELREEVAQGLLETGEISAVEFIGLVNTNVRIYGVENKELYERNVGQALKQSQEMALEHLQKVAKQISERLERTLNERLSEAQKEQLETKKTEVNEKLLKYLHRTDKNGIGKLHKLLSDFQKKVITPERFLNDFEKMCHKYGIDFDSENPSPEAFQNRIIELNTELQRTLRERLTGDQLQELAKIQQEIETYMSEIDEEVRKFTSLLKRYIEQTCIRDSLSFLKYLQKKCAVFGFSFPSSLEDQMKFYATALKRDVVMAQNLLNIMGDEAHAILLVGAGHVCGITKEFKDRKISFVVVIPKDMEGFSKHEEEIYHHSLEGRPLPFSLFGLWPAYLKPPARSLKKEFREYETFLLIIRMAQELKAKGYTNGEIRESIGSFTQGDHHEIDLNRTIYSLGDVYASCRIGNNRGVLRLSHYPIDIDQEPVSPIIRHGKIGKLFYEFIDRGYFDEHKRKIIDRNNERNIASSPLNSDIVEIILKGKDNKGRWVFHDGEQTRRVRDEDVLRIMAGYGGGGSIPPTITITFEGHPDPDDAGAWARQAQAGEFFRILLGLGIPAYITSDPKLIAKREEERERPIVLHGNVPNMTFIDGLPSEDFNQIRRQLRWFRERGFPVIRIDEFSGTPKSNISVIIGHSTEDLLKRIDEFAEEGYFKDKAVMLVICGDYDFTQMKQKLRFLSTIDRINKQGGIVVTSFEAAISDNEAGELMEGLTNLVNRIMNRKAPALPLTDAINTVIKERKIETLKRSIRWDVFLIRDLDNALSMQMKVLFKA